MSTRRKITKGNPANPPKNRQSRAATDAPTGPAPGHPKPPAHPPKNSVAIYDVMLPDDTFEDTVEHFFQMVQQAQENPETAGMRRRIYFDVEGHRNELDGFDHDAYEVMKEWMLGWLAPYVTEIHTPLYVVKNPRPQRNDLPEHLITIPGGPKAEREATLVHEAREGNLPIWDSENSVYIHPDSSKTDHDGQPA
jgi:hypothetical protein